MSAAARYRPAARAAAFTRTASLRGVVGALSVLLSACATYQPQALPDDADLAAHVPALDVPADTLRIPGAHARAFDPRDGLDATETAILAVLNNPDLRAARARASISRAQVFEAGLLPDPQLAAGVEHPVSGPDARDGYSLGLSQSLRDLVTRGAARTGAKARARKVDLEILWHEWQVAEKARQLFARARAERRLHAVYDTAQELYEGRYRRDRDALRRGDITLAVSATDLVSLVDASTRMRQLEQQQNATRHALHALLGLQPGIALRLVGAADTRMPSRAEIEHATHRLAQRRPDLVALQAGYASQEAAVRQAVLEQFPSVSVGVTHARDTGGTVTSGLGVTIDLPLWNRNRGRIAEARATREHLRRAYQARLDEATGSVDRVWHAAQLLQTQLKAVQTRIPELQRVAERARKSMEAGELDAGTYISLREALLAKRAEAIQLESTLAQSRIGLETLLGMPLDPGDATSSRPG